MQIEIKNDQGQLIYSAAIPIKNFKTGSRGYYINGKCDVNGKRHTVAVTMVEIGSKNASQSPAIDTQDAHASLRASPDLQNSRLSEAESDSDWQSDLNWPTQPEHWDAIYAKQRREKVAKFVKQGISGLSINGMASNLGMTKEDIKRALGELGIALS